MLGQSSPSGSRSPQEGGQEKARRTGGGAPSRRGRSSACHGVVTQEKQQSSPRRVVEACSRCGGHERRPGASDDVEVPLRRPERLPAGRAGVEEDVCR